MKSIEITQTVSLSEELLRVQASIKEKGYALTSDKALGMPEDTHLYINEKFYTDELLGPEVAGLPPHDRLRVRDVIEYKKKSGIQPGEYILFRDADFFHNTTSLEPRFEGALEAT